MLSGCGNDQQAQNNKIPNPITDPGGNISGMLDLKDKAQQDVNDATNKENQNINNNAKYSVSLVLVIQ